MYLWRNPGVRELKPGEERQVVGYRISDIKLGSDNLPYLELTLEHLAASERKLLRIYPSLKTNMVFEKPARVVTVPGLNMVIYSGDKADDAPGGENEKAD